MSADPAIRAAAAAIEPCLGDYDGHAVDYATLALEVARPIWAHQLAIAVEEAAPGDGRAAQEWHEVAEFIRARAETDVCEDPGCAVCVDDGPGTGPEPEGNTP